MKKGIVITLVVIGLLGGFMYYISSTLKKMSIAGKKDAVVTLFNAPDDYGELFKKSNKLSFVKTFTSKTRNPISQFEYDEKFRINIYRINISNNLYLNKLINESHVNQHVTYNLTYYLLDRFNQFDIRYKSGRQEKVSGIYLNLFAGKTLTLLKNDSLAYYNSIIKNFSIKYQSNGPQDFFIGSSNESANFDEIPTEIMLQKKHGKLYLILMISEHEYTPLTPGTLLTLMNN